MGEDLDQVTTVTIYKQTYQIRSGGNPEYVKRLAQFVDERMTEVFEFTPTVDSLKVAVLAALNIADEYFSTNERLHVLEEKVRKKSEKMCTLMEPFLDSKSQ
jgi:cell division protein ZapA